MIKLLTRLVILTTIFSLVFSWGAFFEKVEKLRNKEKAIKENLNLKNLGLSNLKDISLKDLAHFTTPDLSSKLEKLKHIIPKDLDPSHHKEIDEFWTGMSEYLRLPKPTDAIDCFGTVSGNLFFRKIRTLNDLLQHSKEGDNVKLHTDYAQFEMLARALEHTDKCVARSQDFERFTDVLDISKDPEELMKAQYLYYQAKYRDLAEPFENIVKEIDSGNHKKAGKLFAEFFKNSVQDFKHTGEDLLAFQAYGNGIAGALGASLPSESLKCYNSKNAKLMIDFMRGLSESVTEGRWYKADESVTEYWKAEGEKLLSQIPKKVLTCDTNSKDTREINEKLGMDMFSQESIGKMWDYISDHNIMYYGYLKSLNQAISKGDYLHAGVVNAHLLQAVAKSN